MDMAFSLLEVFTSFDNTPDPPVSWGSSSYTMADCRSQNLQGTQAAWSLLWSKIEATRLPFWTGFLRGQGEGHLLVDLTPPPSFHLEMRYKDRALGKGCPCMPCMCQLHQSAQQTSEVWIKSHLGKMDLVTLVDFPKITNLPSNRAEIRTCLSDF